MINTYLATPPPGVELFVFDAKPLYYAAGDSSVIYLQRSCDWGPEANDHDRAVSEFLKGKGFALANRPADEGIDVRLFVAPASDPSLTVERVAARVSELMAPLETLVKISAKRHAKVLLTP